MVERNFNAYQKSITHELKAVQDRVRNLIGSAHWLTDGGHKEIILRRVLRSHLPETVRVGQGFVCYPQPPYSYVEDEKLSSRQLDILITQKSKPILLKEDDLAFVTADAVMAIAEVKTKLKKGRGSTGMLEVLEKLSDEIENIRNSSGLPCWAGLFVYEQGEIDLAYLLRKLQEVTNESFARAINCVSLGESAFVRFWHNGQIVNNPNGPVWHAYQIHDLAPSYFVSNIVFRVSQGIPNNAQEAWFPIEGTKEVHRECYITLDNNTVHQFE